MNPTMLSSLLTFDLSVDTCSPLQIEYQFRKINMTTRLGVACVKIYHMWYFSLDESSFSCSPYSKVERPY